MDPRERLCSHDPRNPNRVELLEDEDDPGPGHPCGGCDNCFYGRHEMAEALIKAQAERDNYRAEVERLRKTIREAFNEGFEAGELSECNAYMCYKYDTASEAWEKSESKDHAGGRGGDTRRYCCECMWHTFHQGPSGESDGEHICHHPKAERSIVTGEYLSECRIQRSIPWGPFRSLDADARCGPAGRWFSAYSVREG
jgi:hypothetical protein